MCLILTKSLKNINMFYRYRTYRRSNHAQTMFSLNTFNQNTFSTRIRFVFIGNLNKTVSWPCRPIIKYEAVTDMDSYRFLWLVFCWFKYLMRKNLRTIMLPMGSKWAMAILMVMVESNNTSSFGHQPHIETPSWADFLMKFTPHVRPSKKKDMFSIPSSLLFWRFFKFLFILFCKERCVYITQIEYFTLQSFGIA